MKRIRGTVVICLALASLGAGTVQASVPGCEGVLITEIMYNPVDPDSTNEWIEIYNDGCYEVSLDGWTIEDLASVDFLSALDAGPMTLAPKSYALIIDGVGSTVLTNPAWTIPPGTRIFGTGDSAIGSGLNNSTEGIVLKDNAAMVVDAVMYADTDVSGCGNEADGNGYSLERVDPLGPGDCTNFRSMELAAFPNGGTPGAENHLWLGDSCECAGACCLNLQGTDTTCAITTEDDCAVNGHIYFGIGSFCPDVDECENLLVEVDDLSAVRIPDGVMIRWTTAVEIDTIGFQVLRVDRGGRAKAKVEVSPLIPSHGNSLTGASYQFLDNAKQSQGNVEYFIRDMDVYGKMTEHGPIAVQQGGRIRPAGRVKR